MRSFPLALVRSQSLNLHAWHQVAGGCGFGLTRLQETAQHGPYLVCNQGFSPSMVTKKLKRGNKLLGISSPQRLDPGVEDVHGQWKYYGGVFLHADFRHCLQVAKLDGRRLRFEDGGGFG